jgi:hypothetical protein
MPTLIHPYADCPGASAVSVSGGEVSGGGQWLRGNLHVHTTRSDGEKSPQQIIDAYAALGHGFLMISDHDTLASPDFYATLDSKALVLIPGNEITKGGPHFLHVNADRVLTPHPQRQLMLNEAAQIPGGQGFIIANHPNWESRFDHASIAQLREWTGYAGLEIYNGTIGRLDGSPYATNKWDMLLAAGRRLWGFANDDYHGRRDFVGAGWNVALVRERSVAGVVDALRAGRFYASTGVVISAIQVEGMRIRIETQNAQRIVALHQTARRFAQVDAATIEVEVPPTATYVRFECWGAGEQFAWTQPFFVQAEG